MNGDSGRGGVLSMSKAETEYEVSITIKEFHKVNEQIEMLEENLNLADDELLDELSYILKGLQARRARIINKLKKGNYCHGHS